MSKDPRAKKVKDIGEALRVLLSYCRPHYPIIGVALAASIVSVVLLVLGPNLISMLVSTITEGVEETAVSIDMDRISMLGFILIGTYLGSAILEYLQAAIMAKVACLVGKSMRSDIAAKINRLPLRYFDTHSQGDILSRVANDVDTVTQSLNLSVSTLVMAAATIIGSTIMMFVTEWRLALAAIIPSIVGFILIRVIMMVSQKHFVARQKSLAEVNGHIEEYYAGQSEVRAYNAEEKSYAIFAEANERLRKQTFKAESLSGLMKPIMNFLANLAYLAVASIGALLTLQKQIDYGVVVAFMIYIRLFSSPLSQLGQGFSSIQSALAASEHVNEFLNEGEMDDESGKTALIPNVRGAVSFEHVSFGYIPGRIIVHDFSLEVKPGQKIAIVGPTGAGKTTMVNVLMRFYELNEGKISVDGVSLADLKREDVHKLFGMVLQETWLFEGTLRDNLLYGKEGVSDERLLQICDECGLTNFIASLKEGLDTFLGDNVAMSSGEKQLLTIARAMVADAPLLILDEATPSVDTRTEAKIAKALNALSKGRTSFVIAHRLSTIKDADLILYMQNGDIKETGTHQELMAKDGLYAELYNCQFAMKA